MMVMFRDQFNAKITTTKYETLINGVTTWQFMAIKQELSEGKEIFMYQDEETTWFKRENKEVIGLPNHFFKEAYYERFAEELSTTE